MMYILSVFLIKILLYIYVREITYQPVLSSCPRSGPPNVVHRRTQQNIWSSVMRSPLIKALFINSHDAGHTPSDLCPTRFHTASRMHIYSFNAKLLKSRVYSSVSDPHCVPGTSMLTIHKIFITVRPNEVMEIKFRSRISGSITAHHECRPISTICCLLLKSDKVLGPGNDGFKADWEAINSLWTNPILPFLLIGEATLLGYTSQ